jgi:hypothetical protein
MSQNGNFGYCCFEDLCNTIENLPAEFLQYYNVTTTTLKPTTVKPLTTTSDGIILTNNIHFTFLLLALVIFILF